MQYSEILNAIQRESCADNHLFSFGIQKKLSQNGSRPEWRGKAFKNKNPDNTFPLGSTISIGNNLL